MTAQGNVVSLAPDADYPLQNTEATRMLNDAFERAKNDKGWSQRHIAKLLHYKTSVVLSHMALGRVPIPIDRAMDFARLLGMDASRFLLAVLHQRHPEIDFPRILGAAKLAKPTNKAGRESFILDELEGLFGRPLDELPTERVNVMRELVADPNGAKRWLALHELPTIEAVRAERPNGLSPAERGKLRDFISKM